MAEYVAGRGTTALGIIGTVLGGIGTAAAAGGLPIMNGNAYAAAMPYGNNYMAYGYYNGGNCYQKTGACMHDIETTEKLAEKDAMISKLESERYADKVRDDAKQYGIEIYKELKKDITELKDANVLKWTDQAVVNANLSNGLTALNGQVQSTANLVAQITRTAVPQSAICNFGCGCNTGCGNNI